MKNILHIITSLRKSAGTTTFVENVVQGLQTTGYNAEIVMSTSGFCHCDLFHIHGLWSGLLDRASRFARKNNIPVVWSTHGMTAPWSMHHKWWKKIPAWWLYQKRDLERAAAIHCTTEQEVEWNKALGFKNCFVVPLGTHLPTFRSPTQDSDYTHTLLFVGRIHPVKGLVNLIQAWSLVQNSTCSTCSTRLQSRWKLRIVGPNEAGHKFELESLVQELCLNDCVEFAGPKFGEELSSEYTNCDCLVLPSFTENFGATIVDAMAHGKPCIASTFTPWKDLKDWGCGWWVSNAPEPLALAICEMMSLPDAERHDMGERGRKLADEKYAWGVVVKSMVAGYEKLLRKG